MAEATRRTRSSPSVERAISTSPGKRISVEVAGASFTAQVWRDGRWWVGSVDSLPGCGSQGRTQRELREMLADAIEGYLIVRGDIPAGDH